MGCAVFDINPLLVEFKERESPYLDWATDVIQRAVSVETPGILSFRYCTSVSAPQCGSFSQSIQWIEKLRKKSTTDS